jgi:TPR repeat protein
MIIITLVATSASAQTPTEPKALTPEEIVKQHVEQFEAAKLHMKQTALQSNVIVMAPPPGKMLTYNIPPDVHSIVIATAAPLPEGPLGDADRAYQHQDYATQMGILKSSAESGNAKAQSTYGAAFFYGEPGFPRDYNKAMYWYRRAAVQGDVYAQTQVAKIFYEGLGIQKDEVRADMWSDLAAATGDDYSIVWRHHYERDMTPAQIAEAQARATRCTASKYSDCD